jgi:hypothetical protein
MTERPVTVKLDDGEKLIVVAEQIGPALVGDKDIEAKLSSVVSTIERVSGQVLESIKRVAPSKAVIELGFGLAVQQGELITLFGKARGDATIKVTIEWSSRTEASSMEVNR